jgi:hypothetical protein
MRKPATIAIALAATLAAGLPLPAAYPAEETHSGCVMQTEAGWFTFCETDACSVIKGAGIDAKVAGHKITAIGTVQPATAIAGRIFTVTKVLKVGDKCDQICSPNPPHHRGIGGKDKPGAEGGTPGVVTPPPEVPHQAHLTNFALRRIVGFYIV